MTTTPFNDTFFSTYNKEKRSTAGIPFFEMNVPFGQPGMLGSVGLELEVEATNRLPSTALLEKIKGPATKAMWRKIEDGSLRGSSGEYILSAPCAPEEVAPLVNQLFEEFVNFKTVLNNSNRCSTHVHINMNKHKINHLVSVVCLWSAFEPFLISWCGIERKNNHFCLSLQEQTTTMEFLSNFLRKGRMDEIPRALKYTALNVRTLWEKGSLEFRCGGAPDSPQKVITWALFVHALAQRGKDYPLPSRIANDLSEVGALSMLQSICNNAGLDGFVEEVLEVNGLRREDEALFNNEAVKNFRATQSLAFNFPWEEWLPLIERENIQNPFGKKKGRGI